MHSTSPDKIIGKFAGDMQTADVNVVSLGKGKINLCHKINVLTANAGWGQVAGASKEYGGKILSTLADYLSLFVEELRKIKLPLE